MGILDSQNQATSDSEMFFFSVLDQVLPIKTKKQGDFFVRDQKNKLLETAQKAILYRKSNYEIEVIYNNDKKIIYLENKLYKCEFSRFYSNFCVWEKNKVINFDF